jgi:uncharacterized protein
MSQSASTVGAIAWVDLTVPEAESLRDFYAAVTGWRPTPVPMGGYDDFNMALPGSGQIVAGICHARGSNAELPAAWLIYVVVADLDASLAECTARGGAVLSGPRGQAPEARYAVIRDPAGAMIALYQLAVGTATDGMSDAAAA